MCGSCFLFSSSLQIIDVDTTFVHDNSDLIVHIEPEESENSFCGVVSLHVPSCNSLTKLFRLQGNDDGPFNVVMTHRPTSAPCPFLTAASGPLYRSIVHL